MRVCVEPKKLKYECVLLVLSLMTFDPPFLSRVEGHNLGTRKQSAV